MFFPALVLFTAFIIEGIGTLVSVIGLSALFSANPIIITMAVALDLGKVVSITFLYKNWKKINLGMKAYMSIAAIVLMVITSAGVFGFLSGEFQKAISTSNGENIVINSMVEEQARLQARKEAIDSQIASVPDNNVRGKTQLIRNFDSEVRRINLRLAEIDKKLPELKIATLKKNVEVGPIIYIAEAFNTTPEKAVKWVILVIIFVFDPLAVVLLIAGNFLLQQKKEEELEKPVQPTDVIQPPSPPPVEAPVIEKAVSQELQQPDDPQPEVELQLVNIPDAEDAPVTEVDIKQEVEEITAPSIEVVEEKTEEPEDPPVEVVTEAPQVAPEPETVIDQPREVITIEQLTSSVKRSMLEDIDVDGDVLSDDEKVSRRSTLKIKNMYNSDEEGPII